MYITPSINGQVYSTTDATGSSTLNSLDALRSVAASAQLISPTAYSNSWVLAYNQGTLVKNNYNELLSNVSHFSGSTQSDLNAVLAATDTVVTAYDAVTASGGFTLTNRQNYINALYQYRTQVDVIDTASEAVLGSLSNVELMARKSLQDYLYYTYSIAGEGTLSTQLAELENDIASNKDIIYYLNQINQVLSLNLAVNSDIETTDSTSINNYKSQVSSARDQLATIAGTLSADDADLQSNINYFIALSLSGSLTNLGKWLNNNSSSAALDWWNDVNTSSNINSLFSQVSFLNQSLQNDIQVAQSLYMNFYQSASVFLRTFDDSIESISKKFGKR